MYNNKRLTVEAFQKMHRRKSFLDVLIMVELRNGPMNGYDVIAFIHFKFRRRVLLLHYLERDG